MLGIHLINLACMHFSILANDFMKLGYREILECDNDLVEFNRIMREKMRKRLIQHQQLIGYDEIIEFNLTTHSHCDKCIFFLLFIKTKQKFHLIYSKLTNRFIDDINDLFRPLFNGQCLCSTFILCLTVFETSMVLNDPLVLLKFVIYALSALAQLLNWCWIGNKLTYTVCCFLICA